MSRVTVIVGHGKSPEGRGWGPRIDAADCVIRMWDWPWQEFSDYGIRYDWGVLETLAKVMRNWRQHNRATPAAGWIVSLLDQYAGFLRELPARSIIVDQRDWLRHAGSEAGVGTTGRWELTRGGIAACWAATRALPGETIVLVGCDNLREGVALPLEAAFPAAYRAHPGAWPFTDYRGGVTKYGNHDFPAERRLIQKLGLHRGAHVVFAQDVWP